ncbi:MAG: MATE family efflux transporter [Oscillospiraceae bacterium]|nr:MATE family efflux transporter [Oscillospiraceae bacterium]
MSYTLKMTEGSELKHIILFTLPLFAGNLFQQLYNIVDSIIVGRYLGADKLAAVGTTGSLTYLFSTLCIGLSVGAGILISQRFGAGMHREVRKLITNSAYVIMAFGAVISVISVTLAGELMKMMNTPENLLQDASDYMRAACSGTLCVAAYNWINSVMRSLGDSRTPLIFLVVASLLNVGLDLLFVVALDFGVIGAAYATVISQGVSAAGSIIVGFKKNPYFRLTREDAKPEPATCLRCITTGVPIALQNAMISVSMIFLQRTANGFGETVMAAYTATMRVEQLVQQPFTSLNAAVSTFAGQNIGAGLQKRVIRGYHRSMLVTVGFALAVMGVFLLLGDQIVGLFVDEPEVIAIGGKALKLSCLFYCALGTIHTTRGLLNGAGDVVYAMINGFAEVVGRIGFAIILVHIPAMGWWAVWTTTCLTWVLTALMSLIRYWQGKWKTKCRLAAKKTAEP